ncbi:MAG: AsnC family transcriptional regulator [Nitrososphaeraceae archaeon]|jgi:predicted transcriptional regulator
MPFQLDDYDVAILKELMRDGRKSFREISRETGITTPTVRARLERLINVGFVKSVSPIFDFGVVEENIFENEDQGRNKKRYNHQQLRDPKSRIKKGMKIKLDCEYCKGPIAGHPHIFRFANYERFFCCTGCMSGYKQKYAGRIESIKRKFEEKGF